MNHDDDVRAGREGEAIARLLISAVAAIDRMHFHLHLRQRSGDGHRIVMTRVVHDDDEIDDPLGHDFVVGLAQGAGRVIRGHHDNNFLAVEHRSTSSRSIRIQPPVRKCFLKIPRALTE